MAYCNNYAGAKVCNCQGQGVADLRPVSATPVLFGLVERLAAKDNNFPIIPSDNLYDQFGVKPSGSTTAALVYLT